MHAKGLIALAILAAVVFLPRLVRRLRGNEAPRWIEADDLADRFEGGSGGVVIDVPGLDEFNGPFGQIAKALNLPAGELPSRLIEINALKQKSVILECRTHSAYCGGEWSDGSRAAGQSKARANVNAA